MVQYYTLDEAARVLQTTPEDVRRMADDKKLRYFRDKGTLRFRAQEIDELAREMGLGSDLDLQLGEVPPPKKGNSPGPAKRPSKVSKVAKVDPPSGAKKSSKVDLGGPPKRASKMAPPDSGEVFDFSLSLDEEEAQVQLGSLPSPSSTGSKSGKSGKPSPPSPPPSAPKPPGSDSDIRLVNDGSDLDFNVPLEDNVAPPSPVPGPRTPPTGRKRPSSLGGSDSGVRIVPLDPSDSDVKMVIEQGADDLVELGGAKDLSASDSDIRLEKQLPGNRGDGGMVTEEIDLDAELDAMGGTPKASGSHLPTSSPFELSEEDLQMEEEGSSSESTSGSVTDSSGDFELSAMGEEMSPLELGSDEMPALQMEEDEVSLGDLSGAGQGGSGINLKEPADSGVSLEDDASDEMDFEPSLDAGSTPPPSKKQKDDEDSSEFELSLDGDESSETHSVESSEFELSLDDSGSSELELDLEPAADSSPTSDSDSEFELTLDDSGVGSSPLEEEAVEEDKDIFATDFDVPGLEEESGSEAVALDEDTDLDSASSDFDLAIDELDAGTEDGESGSQVIALDDEEDVDPAAATVHGKKPKGTTKVLQVDSDDDDDGNDDFAGLGPGEVEEEEEEVVFGSEKPPAPWGALPVVLMLPCVIVLFLIGLLGFEMVSGMMNYQKTGKFSGLLIGPLTEMITNEPLPGSPPKKK